MIKVRSRVKVTNENLDSFNKIGTVLFVNKAMDNAYVIINDLRYLIDLKDLREIGE